MDLVAENIQDAAVGEVASQHSDLAEPIGEGWDILWVGV